MLPLPVTDTDLATGEGRMKVCPDVAITELSEGYTSENDCAHAQYSVK
jgi:hypothetical protein